MSSIVAAVNQELIAELSEILPEDVLEIVQIMLVIEALEGMFGRDLVKTAFRRSGYDC